MRIWTKRPHRATADKSDRAQYEPACQNVDTATREGRIAWTEETDDDGRVVAAIHEMPSGKFQLRLYHRYFSSALYNSSDYYLQFGRINDDGKAQGLARVRLRFDFGHKLYYFIVNQIHAEEYAQDRADLLAAINEAETI